jgi:hypothetical protein
VRANVELKYGDRTFALPNVEVSDNPDPVGAREENEMFAMFEIHDALPEVARFLPDSSKQERFLLTARWYVTAQYGRRDQAAEDATIKRYFSHYGLDIGR